MVRAVLSALAALTFVVCLARSAGAEGALVARGARGQERGLFPLVRTEVRAEISGDIVSVDVTQRFRNTFTERIEATYVFPLPDEAAVDDMEMRAGGRVIKAVAKRRDAARAAYEGAKNAGQRAALLEQERPNVFTSSVANIEPGGEIEVRLHYFELARYDAGTYEMVFPMVVGPRYVPGLPLAGPQRGTGTKADTDRVPDASRISPAYAPPGTRTGQTIGLAVHLDAGSELETVASPSHEVTLTRPGSAVAEVALADREAIPNKDFILRWRLAAPDVRTVIFAHRPDANTDGYVAVLIEPRHDPPVSQLAPRELFFLLDTSGSMSGVPLETSVAAAGAAIDALNPDDTFQIIDFADSASSFASRPLANRPENIRRAHAYLSKLVGSGGTNQLAGIYAALHAPGDPGRLRHVAFLTDGYIGNESDVIALVQKEIGAARIFGFGVGSSVNRYLLDEVSAAGRGHAEYLRPREQPAEAVRRFYRRIGAPYLTDVQVVSDLGLVDPYPRAIPDLSPLEPVLFLARYPRGGAGHVTVRGKVAGRPFERRVDLTLPDVQPGNRAVSRIWARARIATLTRQAYRSETPELTRQITETALAHNLVSKYTSLVAVDVTPAAPGARGAPGQVYQAAEHPEGVDVGMAGGGYGYEFKNEVHLTGPLAGAPAVRRLRAEMYTVQQSSGMGGYGPYGCGTCAAGGFRGGAGAAWLLAVAVAAAIGRRRASKRVSTRRNRA